MTRKFFAVRTLAVVLIIGFILTCFSAAQKTPLKVTLLHTNDMHGSYLPANASWLKEKPEIGGLGALDYYVKKERLGSERSLLLDAGDLMTGTLICDLKYHGVYGGSLINMMNGIGYDGWVFGNHDFDKGARNLRGLIDIAEFPVFCANMVKGSENFVDEPYHIYDLNGLRLGVIGITYHPMVGMAPMEKLDGFVSLEPAAVVNKMVSVIDSLTDLIVVLSHSGVDNDREMARQIKGVDLIIGGHSHTRLETPEMVNGVIIVQAGSNCRNLGRIDLTVAGDSVMEYSGRLIPMFTEDIKVDPTLASMIDSLKGEIDKEYAVVIAELKDSWESEYRSESNIGDWFTEAIRRRMNTDVAFLNSGGIRKNLPAGPIRKMDIFEILPFDNKLVTFNLTGAELLKIAGMNVGLESNSYQGSLQIAGLSYCWRGDSSNFELSDVQVNGIPIDKARTYTVASIDYVAISNGDKYFGFAPSNIRQTEESLNQAILEAVSEAKVINSKIEGRIKKLP